MTIPLFAELIEKARDRRESQASGSLPDPDELMDGHPAAGAAECICRALVMRSGFAARATRRRSERMMEPSPEPANGFGRQFQDAKYLSIREHLSAGWSKVGPTGRNLVVSRFRIRPRGHSIGPTEESPPGWMLLILSLRTRRKAGAPFPSALVKHPSPT